MHFASAKSLAQTRRNLIEKVRQASGTGVKVFEQSMNSDLQVPSRARGLSFLSALILFIAFIVVLTYELISERSPLDCNQIQTAAMTMFGNYSAVETMPQLLEYLSTSLPTASIQQSRLGNSRRVGSIRIRQIRTVISCPTNSYWNVYSSTTTVNSSSAVAFQTPNTPLHTTCSLDITNTDFINRSAIVGRITGVTFPFQDEGQYCKLAFCSMDLPSSILDTVTYPYEGNVMFMHAGVLLDANGTPLVATATVAPPSSSNNTTSTTTTLQASSSSASPITTTTPEPSSFPSADPSSTTMSTTTTFQPTTTTITPAPTLPPSTSSSSSDDGSTPSAMATTVVKDLMEDFMQTETRFVQIEATLFHPSSSMATAALLIFECPAAGGVFVTLSVQSVNLFDVNHPRCIFLWAYVVLQILLQLYALVQSLRHSMDCATCSQSSTLIVFKCIKCKSPCELCIGRVSLCGACGTPVPALKHSCWRSIATDIWRIITILSVSSLIVSRIATTLSVTDITNAVGGSELGAPSGQMKHVVSIAAFFSVYRQGISSSIITIICTYIRLFHYVGRGQFGSQFARVLQYSLMPLASFSVNFMVAYSGFCFAFYIAGGPTSVNFSTLSNTFLTSFRFLLSQIGWSELGAVSPGLLALLVLFFIVCFCLMFNIFPSVLSVSYKKAAKTPYYDVDVLSSWLLLKRYVLVPLGIVSGKKKQRRESRQKSRSDSTATSIASDTSDRDDRSSVRSSGKESDVNVTTAQINALRAGDEIEDVMAQQELKLLNKAADDVSLRMLSQEETLRDAVKQLNRNLQVLSTVLGPLMEDYLSLIEEREAAVGKVGSGTTAVRVLRDRIAQPREKSKKASMVMLSDGGEDSRNLSEVLLMRRESSTDDDQQLFENDNTATTTFVQDEDDAVAILQVQSILKANAERLEMIKTHKIALPVIADTSLLAPTTAPSGPYVPSDNEDDDDDNGQKRTLVKKTSNSTLSPARSPPLVPGSGEGNNSPQQQRRSGLSQISDTTPQPPPLTRNIVDIRSNGGDDVELETVSSSSSGGRASTPSREDGERRSAANAMTTVVADENIPLTRFLSRSTLASSGGGNRGLGSRTLSKLSNALSELRSPPLQQSQQQSPEEPASVRRTLTAQSLRSLAAEATPPAAEKIVRDQRQATTTLTAAATKKKTTTVPPHVVASTTITQQSSGESPLSSIQQLLRNAARQTSASRSHPTNERNAIDDGDLQ